MVSTKTKSGPRVVSRADVNRGNSLCIMSVRETSPWVVDLFALIQLTYKAVYDIIEK